MKRLARILGVGAVLACVIAAGTASAGTSPAKPKKKCKPAWVLRKGKCHKRKVRRPAPATPNSITRASLTWTGPAHLRIQIQGSQGRAGVFPGEGNLNEIPNANFTASGGAGQGTQTFTDHLFYGTYGYVYFPSPGNRGFTYTYCYDGSDGTDPSHASLMTVGANGLVSQRSWTITPPGGPEPTGCATLNN